MITKKEIEEQGKLEYAKWRADRNRLDALLIKGEIDESRDSIEPVSV